ncbi:glycosyltransferase family 87 protein [Tundrisphaera lichenicola]|uniref:glycosyltransferase family 87 protein n=1 Tax=Tundrisphaera lichenicola TaxID=2029860 RepID=UPI003EBA2457
MTEPDDAPRTTDGTGPDPARAAILRTWMMAGLAATMIGFSVAPLLNGYMDRGNKDYGLWFYAGRAVTLGEEIYPKDGRVFPFMYPPSCAAFLAVLSYAGEHAFVTILVLANSAAWLAAMLLSVYLATGKVAGQRPWLYVVPSVGVAAYIHDAYLLGQPNMALLACMLGAFACLGARRSGLAGGLVAFAAAVKAFPFMAIVYLIYRRLWKATAAMIVVLTLAMLALPMPFRGIQGAFEDAGTWTMGMVLRYDEGSIAQRPERGFGFKNQSIMALTNRLLRSIPADGEAKDGWKVNLVDLDFSTVNKIIALSALVLGGLYVGVMPREGRRTRTSASIDYALLILLILIFSPLSFNYAFVWLMYPMTVAIHLGLESPRESSGRRILLGSVAGSLALLGLSMVSQREAAGYGNSFWAAAILLASLGWRLAVEPETGSPIQEAGRFLGRLRDRHASPTTRVHETLPGPHPAVGRVNPAKVDRPR